MNNVKPIPEGFRTVTPHLCLRGAAEAIEFYKKAFGAVEIMRLPYPDGSSILHAELKIGDSIIMLCDEVPHAQGWRAPRTLNGTSVTLGLYVEDADTTFQQALDAGAKATMPLMDTFWGDRYGKVTDPFGHEWGIATHKQDLTPEQIAKGTEEFFASLPSREK
jgi:uncharacterized glyoxalase superfamily protein PhnB